MTVIALVPVYNEEATVAGVLDAIGSLPQIQRVVAVNDGSTDRSGELLREWSSSPRATLLEHETNGGYSAALLTGIRHIVDLYHRGELAADDIVVTIDADGQHDAGEIPALVAFLEDRRLDVVWGRRDFSLYPIHKRMGNWLMSQAGSLFCGQRFQDIESGYCLFRVKALDAFLAAHKRDWRYSLSMTLAVTLCRLGFAVSNEPVCSVKIYRSRTRILDVLVDNLALAHARFQVERYLCKREPERARRMMVGSLALTALLAILVLIGIKSVYAGADSANNYAHVWYIANQLWDNGGLPLHMPYLEEGKALTYPYGFIPWTLAALARPAVGDYAVTWTMIAGLALLLLVVYRTQARRQPWLLVLFVLCPFFLEAIFSFQMAFVWALLFAYLYVAALERGRSRWALFWLILAAGTHLLIMGAILALYNAWIAWRDPGRRGTVMTISGIAAVVLLPEAWYIAQTPSAGENSPLVILVSVILTVLPRGFLFIWPFILKKLRQSWDGRAISSGAAAGLMLVSGIYVVALPRFQLPLEGHRGLFTEAKNDYADYLASPAYVPGAVYRVMEATWGEYGQYYLMQRGAVLAQEFFNESMRRQEWDEADYQEFLAEKHIDYVVINHSYSEFKRYYQSELSVLQIMASRKKAHVAYNDPAGKFVVFDVRGPVEGQAGRALAPAASPTRD